MHDEKNDKPQASANDREHGERYDTLRRSSVDPKVHEPLAAEDAQNGETAERKKAVLQEIFRCMYDLHIEKERKQKPASGSSHSLWALILLFGAGLVAASS